MSLADDLLEQAKDLLNLAHPDSDGPDQPKVSSRLERRGRPKQAKLRPSISTAYYSLFSLLVDEAVTRMVGRGKKKKALRGYVTRAISHQVIREVCKVFAGASSDDRIKKVLDGHGIPDDLVTIARTCHNLQAYRHEVDYNFIRSFTKEDAIDIIEETEEAHKKWETIRDNEATKVFLTALIVHKLAQKSGTTIRAPQSSVRVQ